MTSTGHRPLALILGLGRFGGGRGAAQFLAGRGYRLRIADRARPETLAEAKRAVDLVAADVDWRLGVEEDVSLLDGVDLFVVNPAVRPGHPMLEAARTRGIEQTQEINLFLDHFEGRTIVVTGTNGKSTTATLIAHGLRRNGIRTLLGGNIGASLLDAAPRWRGAPTAVLELSSAQLSRIDPSHHRIHAAVFTRITRDHLDWHGSLESYQAAKLRALAIATEFVVHPADDAVISGAARAARTVLYRGIAPEANEVGIDDQWLVSRLSTDPGYVLHGSASRLFGQFHLENLAAAFATIAELGVSRHRAGLSLCEVAPLPHRLQLVAERRGRRLFGNAVSTELQSTVSALRSIGGRIRWVGGGKSKDGDYAGTATEIAPLVESAHLFGAAAAPLSTRLSDLVPVTQHQRLEEALDAAWSASTVGDTILFSPAFASFDQFANFRARAAAFDEWVVQHASRTNADGGPVDGEPETLANYSDE